MKYFTWDTLRLCAVDNTCPFVSSTLTTGAKDDEGSGCKVKWVVWVNGKGSRSTSTLVWTCQIQQNLAEERLRVMHIPEYKARHIINEQIDNWSSHCLANCHYWYFRKSLIGFDSHVWCFQRNYHDTTCAYLRTLSKLSILILHHYRVGDSRAVAVQNAIREAACAQRIKHWAGGGYVMQGLCAQLDACHRWEKLSSKTTYIWTIQL